LVMGILKGLKGLKGGILVLCSMALVLETIGSENKALQLLRKAINISPQNRELHLHASRLFLKKGQVDKAVMHWKKAAGPENIGSFLYWLDKSKFAPGRKKQAGNEREKSNPWDDLAGVVREWPVNQPILNDVGLDLLERGYIQEALQVFLQDLRKGKTDPVLLFNTGLALSKLNRHREAQEYYEKAQNMGLNSLELLNNKGYSLFCLGQFEEAQTCYELARGLAPNDYTILNNLAACYLKTNQTERARNCFLAATKHNTKDAVLENNLAMCLEMTGKLQDALVHYDRAAALEKNEHIKKKIMLNKINCLIKLNRCQEALQICESLLKENGKENGKNEFELWGLRAELLNELGRTREAAECYRKALGLTG